jgi:beta-lactam-binding protein with PASTA domain
MLKTEAIPFEVVGGGSGVIAFQEPRAGTSLSSSQKLLLYTGAQQLQAGRSADCALVPNCVGKNLRDAVNAVNLRGLAPFVIGAGSVTRQSPVGGSPIHHAEACTLLCSFCEPAKKP